jgi:hypothetical protein
MFGYEDKDEKQIVILKQFGQCYEDLFNIDKIHSGLANHEVAITENLLYVNPDNRTNIVLGAISIILKAADGGKTLIHKTILGPESHAEKLRVFDSKTNYNPKETKQAETADKKLEAGDKVEGSLTTQNLSISDMGAEKSIKQNNQGKLPKRKKALEKAERQMKKGPKATPHESLDGYFFENSLTSFSEVNTHINKVWGQQQDDPTIPYTKKNDLRPHEECIWKDFETFQSTIWQQKEQLQKLLLQAALEDFSGPLRALASRLLLPESKEFDDQTENLILNKQNPSKALEDAENRIRHYKEAIKKTEKDFKDYIEKFYLYFWHSEQRFINYLATDKSDAFWESLCDLIPNDTELEGVFLHLHSRHNFCKTCRYALARSGANQGQLFERIGAKLSPNNTNFFFKVLGSYRVPYDCDYKGKRVWMPYKTTEQDLASSQLGLLKNPASFCIARVYCHTEEEQEKDREFFQAFLAALPLNNQPEGFYPSLEKIIEDSSRTSPQSAITLPIEIGVLPKTLESTTDPIPLIAPLAKPELEKPTMGSKPFSEDGNV